MIVLIRVYVKDLTIHKFDTKYKIENKSIVEDMPPNDDYFNILENHIQEINPNMNDWIVSDFQYTNYSGCLVLKKI